MTGNLWAWRALLVVLLLAAAVVVLPPAAAQSTAATEPPLTWTLSPTPPGETPRRDPDGGNPGRYPPRR
ncbi:hypothetical protein [Methanoculleus chikugoensis]|uniref:hypothetical protein n=1 Tax=Methanoculleus chikugoensis TaxID=118126 RepID=UPI001FB56755|nr:hypothetical protein [Methanoculleus chikugoensis]